MITRCHKIFKKWNKSKGKSNQEKKNKNPSSQKNKGDVTIWIVVEEESNSVPKSSIIVTHAIYDVDSVYA